MKNIVVTDELFERIVKLKTEWSEKGDFSEMDLSVMADLFNNFAFSDVKNTDYGYGGQGESKTKYPR